MAGGEDFDPVAVGVFDEVDAHVGILEADAPHGGVLGVEGIVVLGTEGEVELLVAEVVGFGAVAEPGEFELEIALMVGEVDNLEGAVFGVDVAALLEAEGLITLKEGIDASTETATILDIAENPLNLEIIEMSAQNIPHSLPDVAFGVINGNYALQAGLTGNDALASESAESDAAQTYANILAVRAGEEGTEKTQALITALTSETCREYIEATYDGAVVPIF